jgi:hypothetical protein
MRVSMTLKKSKFELDTAGLCHQHRGPGGFRDDCRRAHPPSDLKRGTAQPNPFAQCGN